MLRTRHVTPPADTRAEGRRAGLVAVGGLCGSVGLDPGSVRNNGRPADGLPRYLLAAFPLFMALGTLVKGRRLRASWVAGSALLSLPPVALFVNWYFVS